MADFNVKLSLPNSIRIRSSAPTQDLTLKNTTVNLNRLDSLQDVVEADGEKVDAALLVYDAGTDKYNLTAGILSYDEDTDTYKVNGGTF